MKALLLKLGKSIALALAKKAVNWVVGQIKVWFKMRGFKKKLKEVLDNAQKTGNTSDIESILNGML